MMHIKICSSGFLENSLNLDLKTIYYINLFWDTVEGSKFSASYSCAVPHII
jgi:hypothetical protein